MLTIGPQEAQNWALDRRYREGRTILKRSTLQTFAALRNVHVFHVEGQLLLELN